MNTLAKILIPAYIILMLVMLDSYLNHVWAEEIRFETYSPEGDVSRGTIREWGQDYRIDTITPQGDIETTIIRTPPRIRTQDEIYEDSLGRARDLVID